MIRENDNNNKEYCNCEIAEQLQISEDINNMTDKKNGREYLGYVLEKLKERITEISLSLVEGQKEIEGMHEYYWENYTEMDQYGYENYDNQQALFRQISANEEQLILKQRFRRMADSPFSEELISFTKERTNRRSFILELEISQRKQGIFH